MRGSGPLASMYPQKCRVPGGCVNRFKSYHKRASGQECSGFTNAPSGALRVGACIGLWEPAETGIGKQSRLERNDGG
jgi:hypothetical protein